MDLVQSVRKEGSRGGRGDFKWEDVKLDAQRENYLGHSLMAPVGRWQQGRDLNWYAKANDDTEQSEADKRKEEIRKVKEAEEDAMAAALGLPPPSRNANMAPLGAGRGSQAAKDAPRERNEDSRHNRHRDERDRGDRRHHREERHREERRDTRRRRSRTPPGTAYEERRQNQTRHRRRSASPEPSRNHDVRDSRTGERESNSRRHRSRDRQRSRSPAWKKRRREDLDSDSQATSPSPPPTRRREREERRHDHRDRRRSRSPYERGGSYRR